MPCDHLICAIFDMKLHFVEKLLQIFFCFEWKQVLIHNDAFGNIVAVIDYFLGKNALDEPFRRDYFYVQTER